MAVKKKILSGKRVSWGYEFAVGPRGARQRYKMGGYATKKKAQNAEARKRLESDSAAKITAAGTLGHAIERFFADRADELSPKTMDRYRELAAYLHQDLRGTPIIDVRAMDLHTEWKRLLVSGGHDRQHGIIPTVPCSSCGAEIRQPCREGGTVLRGAHDLRRNEWLTWQAAHPETARPLSAKTVRNIASLVSSACSWAVLYGLIIVNPATASKPPSGPKRKGMALAPSQTELLTSAASGWLADFLGAETGLGIRRGEALALRWADIGINPKNGNPAVHITRSLCQVGQSLIWKGTKNGEERWVDIPPSVGSAFERRRQEQAKQRGTLPEYRVDLDLIFADAFGEPLKPDSVSSKVSLLCKRTKMPKGVSLHTLRHTHGSQLLADHAELAAVSERMGHSDPGTTLGIYTHSIPGKSNLAKQWEELQTKKGDKTQ